MNLGTTPAQGTPVALAQARAEYQDAVTAYKAAAAAWAALAPTAQTTAAKAPLIAAQKTLAEKRAALQALAEPKIGFGTWLTIGAALLAFLK